MDLQQKHDLASQLRAEIEPAGALVLVEFSGLTVKQAESLRGKFREAGCRYRVLKNSTIHFAVEGTKHEPVRELLKGVSGLAYNLEDPGAPARVVRDFRKGNEEQFKVKGGVADGTLLDEAGVTRLADLPGPNELKAQLLALLNTPATQMVRVLNAAAQSFLNLLNAKKEKDEQAA
jgi:large subunit ribosomal protein L10